MDKEIDLQELITLYQVAWQSNMESAAFAERHRVLAILKEEALEQDSAEGWALYAAVAAKLGAELL